MGRKTELNIQASLPLQPHCVLTKGLLRLITLVVRASPCTTGWKLAQYLTVPQEAQKPQTSKLLLGGHPGGGGSCQVLHNSDFTRYFKFTPLVAFFIKALAPLPAHSCSSLLDVSRRFSSSYKPCFLIHLKTDISL